MSSRLQDCNRNCIIACFYYIYSSNTDRQIMDEKKFKTLTDSQEQQRSAISTTSAVTSSNITITTTGNPPAGGDVPLR